MPPVVMSKKPKPPLFQPTRARLKIPSQLPLSKQPLKPKSF